MSHVSGAETSLRWGTEGGTVRREIVISQTRGCENARAWIVEKSCLDEEKSGRNAE